MPFTFGHNAFYIRSYKNCNGKMTETLFRPNDRNVSAKRKTQLQICLNSVEESSFLLWRNGWEPLLQSIVRKTI